MTTRGLRIRTPRKQKVWANESVSSTGLTLAANTVSVAVGLLDDYQADIGVNRLEGVTLMRIVGFLSIGNTFGSSGAGNAAVRWGIAWLRGDVKAAAAGDPLIPDPSEQGERQESWIQRGTIVGKVTTAGDNSPYAAQGQNHTWRDLDIRQMRKQPTPHHELALVVNTVVPANTEAVLFYQLMSMIALP